MDPTPSRSALKRKLQLSRAKYAPPVIKRPKLSHRLKELKTVRALANDVDQQGPPENIRAKGGRVQKRKKLISADDLAWKPVSRPRMGGELGPEGAVLMLEEIEGVNVVYGDERDREGASGTGYYFQVC